jgi:beta-glucosidase
MENLSMYLRKTGAALMVVVLLSLSLFAQTRDAIPKYKNPRLSVEERVNDLVSRLTLEEKVLQMKDVAPAIPRLDIPAYNWWNEALHGVARAGIATVFPQAIGLAATWDTDLMFRVADVISTEARAKHNDFVSRGDRGRYKGLTMWSPNINIFRDPRWGRGQETYGEDPYLTARMGVQFVKGLQGNHPQYFKVIATPKHYAVHSGPEPERHRFDAVTTQRDLYDTYLPAFEACIKEAQAYSIMCAYNRYMGEPCCSHDTLLRKILREDWGFKGYIVSDCGAVYDIYKFHKLVSTAAEASAMTVKAGTDLDCGTDYPSLVKAVKQGLINEAEIDNSVKRLFTARFKLGMFDPPQMVPYTKIPIAENDSPAHRQLALQAARKSLVLLKNQGNLLPLRKDLQKIAVIGPTADDLNVLLGNYNGTPSKFVTLLKGIKSKVSKQTKIIYEQGCDLVGEEAIYKLVPATALSANNQQGLKAEYFNNKNLEGNPTLTRIDAGINSNWTSGEKISGLKETDFSIRWTGALTPEVSGQHFLAVRGDDGYRLWLDDKLIIDNWTSHAAETRQAKVNLEAGRSYQIKLEYFQGGGGAEISFQWGTPAEDAAKRALKAAAEADVIIFVGGITPGLEGEEMDVPLEGFRGGDRTDIRLPKVQENLLKAVQATGKPTVLVLTGGSALAVNWAKENIPAIIQIWYPGEEGGTALADALFGDYNPAGRLPVTFYQSVEQLPPFEDYSMEGRTYRYFKGEPLFSFGYGLSYTRFAYSNLTIAKQVRVGEPVRLSVQVKNAGKIAGDEVVQLYIKNVMASVPVAIRSLQGFKRIHLKAGQSQTVSFVLTPRQMSVIDNQNQRIVEPGEFEITVGGMQPGISSPSTETRTAKLSVKGKTLVIK